tara:strand:+ start:2003 stop:2197 length:195 start_codon:yes stop_codon:yes gene_type:complete
MEELKRANEANKALSDLVIQQNTDSILIKSENNLFREALTKIVETGDYRIAEKCLFEVNELGQK